MGAILSFVGRQVLPNGPPHAEVAASNIAEVLGCQAESSELDRTILLPTPSPSGNLGRGFDRPAWGCWRSVNWHANLIFFSACCLGFLYSWCALVLAHLCAVAYTITMTSYFTISLTCHFFCPSQTNINSCGWLSCSVA